MMPAVDISHMQQLILNNIIHRLEVLVKSRSGHTGLRAYLRNRDIAVWHYSQQFHERGADLGFGSIHGFLIVDRIHFGPPNSMQLGN